MADIIACLDYYLMDPSFAGANGSVVLSSEVRCKALVFGERWPAKFRTPAELQLSLANILVSNSDLDSPTTAFYNASNLSFNMHSSPQ